MLWVVVLCQLYSRLVRFAHKEQIHMHKVVTEQVEEEERVPYKIPLKGYCSKFTILMMSDYEENLDDFTNALN